MQLFINTYGASLRRRGERFLIKAGEKTLQISAAKVQSIVIATGVHFSSDVVALAAQHNVDVLFLDRRGDPIARVWQNRMGSTAAIRRRQLEAAQTDEGAVFVKEWTVAKIGNQKAFLEELQRRRPENAALFDSALATLADCAERVGKCTGGLDALRQTLLGLEGNAGRAYFGCLAELMPAEYRFDGRSRQPAKDGFNAMLNYGYGVLYGLIERACILAGLDPFLGFLHTDNYAKPSLTFDLIEPFRILADRTAVLTFTGRRAQAGFFRETPGGVELAPDGRAYLTGKLNERLDRQVRYPVQRNRKKRRNRKIRDVIQHEAHALANRLLGRTNLPRIVETAAIWDEGESTADVEPETP